jgi:hypothetical protein
LIGATLNLREGCNRAKKLQPTPAECLDGPAPVVTLPARFNKSGKTKVQPLPPDVAERLRVYLSGRPSDSPVWGGTWAEQHRGAEMIRGDLEAAGIPYVVEGPDGPEYADFHALRHSYLTLGGRAGIDLRTLQELAGHSKPELTARYSHRRLYDLTGAVGKLPSIFPHDAGAVSETLRATGTDGGRAAVPGAVPGAVRGGADRQRSAGIGGFGLVRAGTGYAMEPREMQGAGASRHRPALIRTNEDDGTRTRNHRIDRPVPNHLDGRRK